MAKRAKAATEDAQATSAEQSAAPGSNGGETVSGYFRRVFKEDPRLLKERSNEELFRRWQEYHPGHDEVPQTVKTSLQNVTNDLRKKLVERKAERREQVPGQPQGQQSPLTEQPRRMLARGLEQLEHEIDECIALAKQLDRDGLADVISTLRDARNRVVLTLLGE